MADCIRCGGKSLYTRRYSGEVLCRVCFADSISQKTRRTIRRYGMFDGCRRIGVAVSGGKDSLSLLKVLSGIYGEREKTLVALSVDEGVAGYRDEALAHASVLAKELGVEHFTVSYAELFGSTLDQAMSRRGDAGVSSCSFCGVLRRRAIDEVASRAGVEVVATAHNLDDFVQTFMMNLMHGDVSRLAWMDPSYSDGSFPFRRVKPFMEVYEEEVALYAHVTGTPFQSVSCPYMHEGLRSEVRDYLNRMEAGHPGMKNVLLRSSLEVIAMARQPGRPGSVPCRVCGMPSSSGLCGVCRVRSELDQQINYTEEQSRPRRRVGQGGQPSPDRLKPATRSGQ